MIVESGSKGNPINITQMISCLGQQNVDGKRIPYGFDSRTLPHYTKFDDSPIARGFVENSYISGLSPSELFFHAMGGRIGLIDTAVKSVTGDTALFVLENYVAKRVNIGEWIDEKLKEHCYDVKIYPHDRNLELLELKETYGNGIFVPTTDMEGHVSWGLVTAMTRHDPGYQLYEIKTWSGKKVIVSEGKSMLVWREDHFEEIESPNVQLGDYVPATAYLPSPPNEELYTMYNGYVLDEQLGLEDGLGLAFYLNVLFSGPESTLEEIELLEQFPEITVGELTIPTFAFIAPISYVIGYLTGFFSGIQDCTITSDEIKWGCGKDIKVLEGLIMLLNRMGVYGIMKTVYLENDEITYFLVIESHWARVLHNEITLLIPERERLVLTILTSDRTKFMVTNNVVLDPIIQIRKFSPGNKYRKLYDLTVPSTLNFGLANGLQVRDTSNTGYIQRRLIKGMEDIKVEYDMTVRNNSGRIIQFAYGDDGFDSAKTESQMIPLVSMSVMEIYQHFDTLNNEAPYTTEARKRFKQQFDTLKERFVERMEEMLQYRDQLVTNVFKYKNETNVVLPVQFQYIIGNIQGQLGLAEGTGAIDITPLEAWDFMDTYLLKLRKCSPASMTLNPLFEIMFKYYLNPRDLLLIRRFHRAGLILLLETILLKYKEAIVHPGEMVGIISAHGHGAEMTQLTLNTFHNVASKSNVTRGVPRVDEILRLTQNPKNTCMTVYLKPEEEGDKDKVMQYMNDLELTTLGDVVNAIQICFDPNEYTSNIPEDQLLLDQYKEFEQMMHHATLESKMEMDEEAELFQMKQADNKSIHSKWIVRLEINSTVLLDKNLTMDDIHFAIKNSAFKNDVECVFSDYNMDKLVFRIRMNSSVFSKKKTYKGARGKYGTQKSLDESDEIYLLKQFQDSLLNSVVLRGIHGIKNVQVFKIQNYVTKKEGKYVPLEAWNLCTTGSNFLDTLALPWIDSTRTITNHICNVYEVLGIEAARQMIHDELVEVMEFSGIYINYHHLSLLCDRMTCRKDMVAIFRSGLFSDNIGTLAKASFEVHTEVLLNAARHGDLDPMKGVSANIMCGQHGCYGTSSFGLLMDQNAFATSMEANRKEDEEEEEDEDRMQVDVDINKIQQQLKSNGVESMEIKNNVVHIRPISSTVLFDMKDDGYNLGF